MSQKWLLKLTGVHPMGALQWTFKLANFDSLRFKRITDRSICFENTNYQLKRIILPNFCPIIVPKKTRTTTSQFFSTNTLKKSVSVCVPQKSQMAPQNRSVGHFVPQIWKLATTLHDHLNLIFFKIDTWHIHLHHEEPQSLNPIYNLDPAPGVHTCPTL